MNYVQVAGHVGKDPEVRFTPDGKKVTTFSVATNKKKKGQDITIWYRVTVWGDQFEKLMPYIKKGSGVVVVGDLEARLYTDKEGRPQISLEVSAWNIGFSPFGKSGTGASTGGASTGSSTGAFQEAGAGREEFSSEPMKGSMQPSFAGAASFDENDGDQVPF